MLFSLRLERALRWATVQHDGQTRRGTGTPYAQHVFSVSMILDRLGFSEDVVISGLLHDLVEDTEATLDEIREEFGPEVGRLVDFCSEVKLDASGQKRPWIDRKRDHLEALADAPVEARAVILADKFHNLLSIVYDLSEGRDVWSLFHADRGQVLWYYATAVDRFSQGDPRLQALGGECRRLLAEIETLSPINAKRPEGSGL